MTKYKVEWDDAAHCTAVVDYDCIDDVVNDVYTHNIEYASINEDVSNVKVVNLDTGETTYWD